MLISHAFDLVSLLPLFFVGRTVDTGADAGTDDETDAGSPEPSIADAGKKFLDGLSDADKEREFEDLPEESDTETRTGKLAKRPVPAEAVADVNDEEEVEEEVIGRETDEAQWKKVGTSFRWVNPDGSFAQGEPPKGWVKPAAAPAAKPEKTDKAAPVKADDADEPDENESDAKLVKVVLSGEKERGEDDIEVEVDEDVAERIRRNQKNGLRRKDFERLKAQLDARAADDAETDEEVEVDPVGFLKRKIPTELRLDVARALVVDHFDDLRPDLEKFMDDEPARLREQVAIRDRATDSQKKLDQRRAARTYATKCLDAARALVPEHIDDEVRDAFMTDARRELQDAARNGDRITPETVKDILSRRVKLYRFDEANNVKPAAKSAADKPDKTEVARPVSEKARRVAEEKRPTKADAEAAQSRLRRVQRARSASARQAPAGAGAAPTSVPILKPAEETDVRTASKALRQRGLPDTWTRTQ